MQHDESENGIRNDVVGGLRSCVFQSTMRAGKGDRVFRDYFTHCQTFTFANLTLDVLIADNDIHPITFYINASATKTNSRETSSILTAESPKNFDNMTNEI